MIKRIKNTLGWLSELELDTLESIKVGIFFIVIADVFGVWWYLDWKAVGGAIFITCIILLSIILILIRRCNDKMDEAKEKEIKELEEKLKKLREKESEPEKKEETKSKGLFGIDLGIGSSEEYNKRMEDALGVL